MSNFTHLHVHTEYSLLDGLTTPEELAVKITNNGQRACAITDHGTMAGALRFQSAAVAAGINPIFGCEFYFVPSLQNDTKDKSAERYHLILLAKNDVGLQKLFHLQRKSWTYGFYYKPRIEFDDIVMLGGDVICLSGCMGGYISQRILENDLEKAEFAIEKFSSVFEEDFYIEVQPWNPPLLNHYLLELADKKKIEIVGTIDSHYPTHEHRGIEEVLLAIGQQSSMNAGQKRHLEQHCDAAAGVSDLVEKMDILFPDRRLTFKDHHMHLMNYQEVKDVFADLGIHDNRLMDNSMVIADKCSARIATGQSLLPKFSKFIESNEYLAELVNDAIKHFGFTDDQRYIDRANHELEVINRLDFADYFLSIWDIVAWAKRQEIAVGHSRGSVGGSLVAYLLGITNVDPIKFNLLFARFINEERNDYPDIDLDFEDARRHEVKQYIKERWGEENVASITTFGQYKPKSTIKDVSRIYGLPFKLMNELTSKFETIEELESSSWAKGLLRDQPDLVPVAKALCGRIRNAGAHAAGVVVSSKPLHEVLPIETRKDREGDGRTQVTAFDMDECAKVGLIKIDILGVRAITVTKDAIAKIKENHGIDVTEQSLTLDDPKVFEAFNEGYLTGIFQVEASAYRHLISEFGIDNFQDLVASNALVRPGAMITQGASYIARKRGRENTNYPHGILEPILKETYGKFLYQEQLMQASVDLAGFSWAEADALRKIIGKKRESAEFDKYRDQFIAGASRYISEDRAAALWNDFEMSSTYMFNKSHAVAYSMLSYQTMWLKTYYPLEFIWASLYNETNQSDVSGFLMEAKRLGVPVLPPDVSYSGIKFTLHNGTIRFGLSNVAKCGVNAAKIIIENRPYSSYDEFCAKTPSRSVTKAVIENLDKVGAFESLGHISQFQHSNYYVPILSYALGDDNDEFSVLYSACADAEQSGGWNIIKGMVKSTTRKPNYFRVEIEDSSGIAYGFCHDLAANLSTRDYIVALMNDKNLVAFCDASNISDNVEDKLVLFIREHLLGQRWYELKPTTKGGKGVIGVILRPRKFTTKSGYEICSIDYWDGSEIKTAKMDSNAYDRNIDRLHQFNTVVFKMQGEKNSATIIDVRLLQEYLAIKNISAEVIM